MFLGDQKQHPALTLAIGVLAYDYLIETNRIHIEYPKRHSRHFFCVRISGNWVWR